MDGEEFGVGAVVEEQLVTATATLKRVWGYESFRPLQQEAVAAALSGRDSLVVLPTGGGKSLCFQVPALCLEGVAVVVSPLISLMKDQVDGLHACGVPAAFLNSTQRAEEQREIAQRIRAGELKLLYVAPERLLSSRMLEFLSQTRVSMFAIDEAHCISDWGHDFRPEYRGLRVLKERFAQVPVHAYTATAPEHVRADIVKQLGLSGAEILVGSFDRPNLTYRMLPAQDRMRQVLDVVARHPGESGIIYCISRNRVDRLAATLTHLGMRAAPYHAGMNEEDRKRNQEAFIRDQVDIIVATVAFGMGIDKPDVRYVVHAGMPKSIENYQQESGRGGRDGLESECVLIYSGADLVTWKKMSEGLDPAVQASSHRTLSAMYGLCVGGSCRHKALSAYFGQRLAADNCGACDVCLGELDQVDDPTTLGQKILSCILRLEQRFGTDYTAKVLIGSSEQRIIQLGHDRLSTYGLLKEHQLTAVRLWIDQLISQGFVERGGEFQTLSVTESGRRLLRRELTPVLTQPARRRSSSPARQAAADNQSWEGVDRGLFEHLKQVRMRLATQQAVPAYVIFGDATLRELARSRPSSLEALRTVRGIGQQKLENFGQTFLDALDQYCGREGLARDCALPPSSLSQPPPLPKFNPNALAAFDDFRRHASIAEVAQKLKRATSTVADYLSEYLQSERITDATPWVDAQKIAAVEAAAATQGDQRLKPIFEALEGKVAYEEIRIVLTCRRNRIGAATA